MDNIIDIAEFVSDRFKPFLPEDSQVNPGVYGAELAYWLSDELARRGIPTSYPENEDWGWYIEYSTATGAEFAVHCGNIMGADNEWLLSLRRFGRKLFGRDKPPFSDARQLIHGIQNALESEPSITRIQWLFDKQEA